MPGSRSQTGSTPHGGRYEAWEQQRAQRRSRREAVGLGMQAAALELMLVAVFLQSTFGLLRGLPFADLLARAALVGMPVLAVAMLVSPHRVVPSVAGGVTWLFRAVLTGLLSVLLAALYVLAWPYTVLAARRAYARRHPGAAAWVGVDPIWRRSTWLPKRVETLAGSHRHGVAPVLAVFSRQRAWFLLVMTVLLLVMTLLSILAHSSSVVAPLVYTLV